MTTPEEQGYRTPNSFMADSKLTLLGSLGRLCLGVLTAIVLARSLGIESFGLYALYLVFVNTTVNLASLSLGAATTYYVARQDQSTPQVVRISSLISALLGILAVLVGWTLVMLLPSLFSGTAPELLFLAGFLILEKMMFLWAQAVLKGLQDFYCYNKTIVTASLIEAALVTVLALTLQLGIWSALLALLLSELGALLVAVFGIRRGLGGPAPSSIASQSRHPALGLISYGLKSHAGNILSFLNLRLDKFLVNALVGPAALGVYHVAVGLAERLWLISSVTSTVLFPRVASIRTHQEQVRELTTRISRNILWLTLIGAVPVSLGANWLISLGFGSEYETAGDVLRLLLPGIVLISMARVLASDIGGRGQPWVNTTHAAWAVAVNVGANLLLIPRYGVYGAAVATTLSYTLVAIVKVRAYSRIAGVKEHRTWLLTRQDLQLWRRFATRRPGS